MIVEVNPSPTLTPRKHLIATSEREKKEGRSIDTQTDHAIVVYSYL
jgi:hypothetical protein